MGTNSATRQRILLVEDDPIISKMIRTHLERLELEIETASTGREAMSRLEANPPDLVCLDLMLPEMSGFEVCEQIQRSAVLREIPVLVISARSQPADRARAYELGARGYLVKPFQGAELRKRVGELLQAAAGGPAPRK